jgi:hypothetical protein
LASICIIRLGSTSGRRLHWHTSSECKRRKHIYSSILSNRQEGEGSTGCSSSPRGKIITVSDLRHLLIWSRAYALQRHRPLSLQATITLPTQNDDPTDPQAHHLHGFIHLVNLFRPFDETFVALWNKTRTDCSPAYLAALQKQLTDALPTYLNSTENQAADLRTSQQWLRTMVWQLSIQNGCLSSGSDDPSMTFQYPVEISRDLVSMTSQFSHASMEVHGIGLVRSLRFPLLSN